MRVGLVVAGISVGVVLASSACSSRDGDTLEHDVGATGTNGSSSSSGSGGSGGSSSSSGSGGSSGSSSSSGSGGSSGSSSSSGSGGATGFITLDTGVIHLD